MTIPTLGGGGSWVFKFGEGEGLCNILLRKTGFRIWWVEGGGGGGGPRYSKLEGRKGVQDFIWSWPWKLAKGFLCLTLCCWWLNWPIPNEKKTGK